MNRLAAILPADNVLVNVDASSKKRAFEHAGLLFENHHADGSSHWSPTTSLPASAWGRPAWGMAWPIPHGRVKGLKNPLAAVLRLAAAHPASMRPTMNLSAC